MIGITGGIGSGKSTVAQALVQRGFRVYDCDREAKRLVAQKAELREAITALLGKEAFVDGHYNTPYVAQRVFAEPRLLQQLNSIIHPAVAKDILHVRPDFVESAILYEAGLDKLCKHVVVIDAPEEIRIARTINRDYHGDACAANIDKVRARMRTQNRPQGDLILLNDGATPIEKLVEKITCLM